MSTTSNEDDILKHIQIRDLDPDQQARAAKLAANFSDTFGRAPDAIIRAPGRVNLIGDHIDYHGFAVLPMAIRNSIWVAISLSAGPECSSSITVANTDDETYPRWKGKHSFAYGATLDRSQDWHNYALCGYHGTLATDLLGVAPADVFDYARELAGDSELLERSNCSLARLPELAMLVDSDLPPASGLSSSSALVCASAVAAKLLLLGDASRANPARINLRDLAASCASYEHLIGTHGGGMDQAVIMSAQEGYAKHVGFVPELRCDNIHLPKNMEWLVAHCGHSYPKAATSGYNARVLETKLAAALIASTCGATGIALDRSITLGLVGRRCFCDKSAAEIIETLRANCFQGQDEFAIDELCNKLKLTRSELIRRFNTSDSFLREELHDRVKLLSRCEHVFEEAERVERFRSICDTTTDIALLGHLMTQSHYSLRDKYACSHPALDRLVGVALEAGALGARLTGAGWGGCVVALVEASKSNFVLDRLRDVSRFSFRTEPQSGCCVINLN